MAGGKINLARGKIILAGGETTLAGQVGKFFGGWGNYFGRADVKIILWGNTKKEPEEKSYS